jgi:hypothetical protein
LQCGKGNIRISVKIPGHTTIQEGSDQYQRGVLVFFIETVRRHLPFEKSSGVCHLAVRQIWRACSESEGGECITVQVESRR